MAKRWSGYLILGMWLLNLLHLYLGFSPGRRPSRPGGLAAHLALAGGRGTAPGAGPVRGGAGTADFLLLAGASLTAGDWLLPNINMLTMFAAVSTLNLATSGLLIGTTSWQGRKGLWSTMASLNLLGPSSTSRCCSSSAIGWNGAVRWSGVRCWY